MTNSYIVDEKAKKFRIFKDAEPPTFIPTPSPLHKHEYAEVHLIAAGYNVCTVEGIKYVLDPGDALIIPRGMYHAVGSDDEKKVHFSFQVELPTETVEKRHFPKEFIKELFERMARGDQSLGTLSYICTELAKISYYKLDEANDYRHAIGDFFDKRHHENVEIKDLAATLHLSRMQTQRLVKQHTGMTFGENLRRYRMRVAEYLMTNSNMTNEEIARAVGYSSYSGFWKARNREKTK